MKFRKISAEKIFDGNRFHEKTVLIVTEEGRVEGLVGDGSVAAEEHYKGLLIPGLVNCHCHLELSHMKGQVPKHTGLVDFVQQVITGRHFSDEVILQAIASAESEMRENGIVAVGDICNNTLTIPQKKEARLAWFNFVEVSGWNPAIASARYLRSNDIYEEFAQFFPTSSLVPHAPYSLSDSLWNLLIPGFAGKIVTIHNQETKAENELFEQGSGDFNRLYQKLNISNPSFKATGKTSLQSYFKNLETARRVILVHNSFTSPEDMQYLQKLVQQKNAPPTFLCLCPNANLYIENTLPPVDLFRSSSLPIVLGTDSLASNDSLDILSEMRTLHHHFPQIPPEEILRWGTINGARALGMEERFGSFESGKTPGCILIDDEFNLIRRLI